MANDSDLIPLRDGVVVPFEALRKLLELEDRGLDVRLHGTDIVVRPPGVLSDEDRAEIRRLKSDLVALIAYCCAQETRQ
jgi:hypothetical protein